jgi:hypothetical protein
MTAWNTSVSQVSRLAEDFAEASALQHHPVF